MYHLRWTIILSYKGKLHKQSKLTNLVRPTNSDRNVVFDKFIANWQRFVKRNRKYMRVVLQIFFDQSSTFKLLCILYALLSLTSALCALPPRGIIL